MLIDDKRAVLRLTSQPEFVLRLDEFLVAHNPAGAPALVVQAKPAMGVSHRLNVDDPEIQRRFSGGAGGQDGWWYSFRATSRVKPTFHGIASLPASSEPGWASEAHWDAHFIAGTWAFPEFDRGGVRVSALADFYGKLFEDFFTVVQSTLMLGDTPIKCEATATVVGARQLHFARKSDWGDQYGLSATPLQLDNLQFPVYQAEVGTAGWTATPAVMAQALCGAYGATPVA